MWVGWRDGGGGGGGGDSTCGRRAIWHNSAISQSSREMEKSASYSWVHLLTMITLHYNDVIMRSMASQITTLTIVCSTVYSGADKGKHPSSASLAFVRGFQRWPMNSPHKGPVTQKMFSFDDVIMLTWLLLGLHTPSDIHRTLSTQTTVRNNQDDWW